jgi:hypothetical protein
VAKFRWWTDPGVARIILKAQALNEDRRRADLRKLRRESMAAMMLGTASLSLASVMMIVTFMGLFGMSFGSLSEPREVMVRRTATGFIDRWLSVSDSERREIVPAGEFVSGGRILVPSNDCSRLAFLGLVLGGMGLALSVQRRKFSWSSALGLTLVLVMMVTVVTLGTLLRLLPVP